jgi:hypothetical protein
MALDKCQITGVGTMMQMNEMRQQLQHIGQTIHQAASACSHTTGVPMDLKDCVQQMDQRSHQMEQKLQSADQNWMMQCVEDLEQMGDRAKEACEKSGAVAPDLRQAVMQAHDELSRLKHQLH